MEGGAGEEVPERVHGRDACPKYDSWSTISTELLHRLFLPPFVADAGRDDALAKSAFT